MFIESFIFSILIGFIRKGSINNLGLIHFQRISLLFVAFFLQHIIDYIGSYKLQYYGSLLHILSYLILLYFCFKNYKKLNIYLVLGFLLNFIVIYLNNGSMPVLTKYMPNDIIEKISASVTHTVLGSSTILICLSDIIYISWPTNQMLSIGDVFIDIGIFMLVQKAMVSGSIVTTANKC